MIPEKFSLLISDLEDLGNHRVWKTYWSIILALTLTLEFGALQCATAVGDFII